MSSIAATPFQATWAPRALGALRIVAGYLFIAHGTTKLFQAPHIEMFANVPLLSLAGAAGVIFLAISVVGGCAWSLDNVLRNRRNEGLGNIEIPVVSAR